MNKQHIHKVIPLAGMLSGVEAVIDGKIEERTITLPVHGLTCASCVSKVEKGLMATQGVASAKVNLATERATIEYDETKVQPAGLIKAIRDLGYDAGSETLTFPVEGMSCASCVNKVQKALSGVEGVLSATVNFAAEQATVEFLSGILNSNQIKETVENLGYVVPEILERQGAGIKDAPGQIFHGTEPGHTSFNFGTMGKSGIIPDNTNVLPNKFRFTAATADSYPVLGWSPIL